MSFVLMFLDTTMIYAYTDLVGKGNVYAEFDTTRHNTITAAILPKNFTTEAAESKKLQDETSRIVAKYTTTEE
jgi:hypothetical protein